MDVESLYANVIFQDGREAMEFLINDLYCKSTGFDQTSFLM